MEAKRQDVPFRLAYHVLAFICVVCKQSSFDLLLSQLVMSLASLYCSLGWGAWHWREAASYRRAGYQHETGDSD